MNPRQSSPTSRRRRLLAAIAVTSSALVVLAGCSSGGSSDSSSSGTSDPFKVGVVADLTGSASATFASSAYGVQAAFQAINDAGGVNGRKIVATTYDSASTPDQTQVAARQAVGDEPSVIVGASLSAGIVAASPVFDQSGIAVLTNSPADELLLPTPKPWYFVVGATAQQQATALVSALTGRVGGSLTGKQIVLTGLDSAAVTAIFSHVTDLLNKGGATVIDQEKSVGAITSYTAQAQKIKALNPDGVISVDLLENFVIVGQALKDAGVEKPYIGTEGANSDSAFQRLAWDQFISGRSFNTVADGSVPALAAKAAGVDYTGAYFPAGWSIGNVIGEALKNCEGSCDATQFTTALAAVQNYTVPGDVPLGPLSLGNHAAISTIQDFIWDPTTSSVVKYGDPIKVN